MDSADVRTDDHQRSRKSINLSTRGSRDHCLKIINKSSAMPCVDDPRDWWKTRFVLVEYIASFSDE
jgi:hypothetical protein